MRPKYFVLRVPVCTDKCASSQASSIIVHLRNDDVIGEIRAAREISRRCYCRQSSFRFIISCFEPSFCDASLTSNTSSVLDPLQQSSFLPRTRDVGVQCGKYYKAWIATLCTDVRVNPLLQWLILACHIGYSCRHETFVNSLWFETCWLLA